MPVIYSSEQDGAEEEDPRGYLKQYTLWFERNDFDFGLEYSSGGWLGTAWCRNGKFPMTSMSLQKSPAKALHACYLIAKEYRRLNGDLGKFVEYLEQVKGRIGTINNIRGAGEPSDWPF